MQLQSPLRASTPPTTASRDARDPTHAASPDNERCCTSCAQTRGNDSRRRPPHPPALSGDRCARPQPLPTADVCSTPAGGPAMPAPQVTPMQRRCALHQRATRDLSAEPAPQASEAASPSRRSADLFCAPPAHRAHYQPARRKRRSEAVSARRRRVGAPCQRAPCFPPQSTTRPRDPETVPGRNAEA